MMLKNTTHRRSLTAALCVAALLVATSPTATPFGDNDGGLDLPGLSGGNTPGSGGSGGSGGNQQNSSNSSLTVVSLAGADTVVAAASDPTRGRVTLGTDLPLSLSVATSAAADASTQATQAPAGQGVAAVVEQGRVSLQGSALLPATSPYDRQLQSPVDSVASISMILVDSDPSASLQAVLSSNVLLDQWRLVDDPQVLDLDGFARLVQNKAQLLAPQGQDLRVTWLIGSLDSQGQLHLTAARVSTLGGPIEIATL